MTKCILSLKVHITLSLVHLIYTAGDNCMRQNACLYITSENIDFYYVSCQTGYKLWLFYFSAQIKITVWVLHCFCTISEHG